MVKNWKEKCSKGFWRNNNELSTTMQKNRKNVQLTLDEYIFLSEFHRRSNENNLLYFDI